MPLFELPIENNKYNNFEWREGGGMWKPLFPVVTLFQYNVSTIFSPIEETSTYLTYYTNAQRQGRFPNTIAWFYR